MAIEQIKFLLMFVLILVPQTTLEGGMGSGLRPLAPLNRVVYEEATNTTMMTCENSDTYLDWAILAFAYSGSQPFRELTNYGEIVFPFNESFAIDHSQGAEFYSLVIFNATISPSNRATISTAGIYLCQDPETGSQVAAQLVVIRTDPICSSNVSQSTAMLQLGDAIQLTSTIVYGAFREMCFIDAVMTWSVNGQPIPADNTTFTITTSPTEITATSTLVVNKNYDATYECGTTFSQPADDTPPFVANNAPDYFKTCTISLSQPTTTPTTITEGSQSTTNEQATTSFSLSSTSTTTAEVTSTTAEEIFTTISSSSSTSTRANGVITLAPLNRVVYEGATNTTMACESNDTLLDWLVISFAYTGSSDLNVLTTDGELNPPFNESFAVDHSQGTEVYTLVIFNATISPSDKETTSTAGIYQCYYSETGSAVAAQLIVIRAGPICSSNFTQSTSVMQSGDVIQLSCTIIYGAYRTRFRINAVMTWSVNGQPIPADNVTFEINSSPQEITATSTLVVNENSDATYECETTFSQPADDPPPEVANNAPDYFKTCTISLIQPITTPTTATTNTTSSLSQSATTTAEVTSTTAEETFTTISSSSSTSTRDQCLPNLKNIVVYEGQQNTVMHQGTHPQSITWSVLPSSDEMSLLTIIDLGGNMNPMLTNLYDAGLADLVIKNATTIGNPISTAGLYVGQCDNDIDKTGAKLLVIRKGPECSSIPIDSTSSIVSCSVTFADIVLHPMYPIITWKLNGAYLASDTLRMERIDPYVFYAQSNITSDSGVPENYTCELTFAAPIDIKYPWIATNAPDFKESCSITG